MSRATRRAFVSAASRAATGAAIGTFAAAAGRPRRGGDGRGLGPSCGRASWGGPSACRVRRVRPGVCRGGVRPPGSGCAAWRWRDRSARRGVRSLRRRGRVGAFGPRREVFCSWGIPRGQAYTGYRTDAPAVLQRKRVRIPLWNAGGKHPDGSSEKTLAACGGRGVRSINGKVCLASRDAEDAKQVPIVKRSWPLLNLRGDAWGQP